MEVAGAQVVSFSNLLLQIWVEKPANFFGGNAGNPGIAMQKVT